MKKIVIIASVILSIGFGGISFAKSSLNQSISRMNQNGLTKFNNAKDFMSSNNLRRDEASKFFVQYAKEILGLKPDTSKTSCNFNDLDKAWPDLKTQIKESCQLGLFQGYNGKFMPTQQITNAQAITVFVRMLDGKKDETQGHFAQKYFEKAQELGIMEGLTLNYKSNFDKLTTRGDIGILLYNASILDSNFYKSGSILKTNCPINSHPDSVMINVCSCNTGYRINISNNACELDKSYCPDHSLHIGKNCICDVGYKMNTGDNVCEISGCPENAERKGEICVCKTGYEFNESDICEKNCPTNASLQGNSCSCDAGYRLNSLTNTCEALIEDGLYYSPIHRCVTPACVGGG